MKHPLLLMLFALLPACALFQRPPRPSHASPQEAQGITFPMELLAAEGNVSVSGTMFAAMQLAMEDFLPWDTKPHQNATLREVCLYKRDSYDVIAAPGSEGLVFVEIYPRPGACEMGGPPILHFSATYAIDVKTWRILAVQR